MAKLGVTITGFVIGDDLPIERVYSKQPLNMEIGSAYFMIKNREADDDADALISKHIFPILSGPGQITKENSGSEGTFAMIFYCFKTETATLRAGKPYFYGMKIIEAVTESEFTLEKGTITFEPKMIEGPI